MVKVLYILTDSSVLGSDKLYLPELWPMVYCKHKWRGESEAAGEIAQLMAPPSHTFLASWSGTRVMSYRHNIQ